MMTRTAIFVLILLNALIGHASSNYQIDLILFTDAQSVNKANTSPIITSPKQAIQLTNAQAGTTKPYQLVPRTKSQLQNEYYLLNRTHKFQMIGHYSWIQPAKNNSPVTLPTEAQSGWNIHGTCLITQGAYYTLKTDLQLVPPNQSKSYLSLVQNQRLKSNKVYYLDHPETKVLIKITPV